MKKRTYKVSSKNTSGYLLLTYVNGVLKEVKTRFRKKLSHMIWARWKHAMPYDETVLLEVAKYRHGIVVEEKDNAKNPALGTKVALFCRHYRAHNPLNYQVNKQVGEQRFLKDVEVTDDLMKAYFACDEWWSKPKSISNYAKNFNTLKGWMKSPNPGNHPDSWNEEYSRKLDAQGLMAYREHLWGLGLIPKKDSTGKTIDWVPRNTNK